jgi:hypothetical protein
MRRARRVIGTALACSAAAALGLPAGAAAGPDPVNQPLRDGCQRNPVGLLTYTSPEWVFVGGKQSGDPVRAVEGASTLVHTADEDLPQGHSSYDLDWDVSPDPAYAGLLAGDPSANGGQGNGNYAHDADFAKLHVEWETGSVPSFAWPTDGDRVKVWGQWIWDCGHWGEGIQTDQANPQGSLVGTGDYFLPGQVEGGAPAGLRGEQTELHPMQAIVVNRRAPYRAVAAESETDAFISSDGTHALGNEQCAKQLNPVPGLATYGPDFSGCVNAGANERQNINGRSYDFFVPAPPRPSPSAQLRVREEQLVGGHGASEQITPVSGGVLVHVAFDQVGAGDTSPLGFGRSYFVGWEGGSAAAPEHVQLVLKSIKVNHSLDPNTGRPTSTGVPPGEYNLYVNANSFWSFIGGHGLTGALPDEWAPPLGAVTDGQEVPVNRTVDFFVPRGAPVRLDFSGRECDLPRIDPSVVNGEVSDGNDHPGEGIVTFPSAGAAVGDHTLTSPVNANYQVNYAIRTVAGPGNGPTPPGSTGVASSSLGGDLHGVGTVLAPPRPPLGCYDLNSPRSRFTRRARARTTSRRRIVLRGHAADAACGRSRGRVKRVQVALARRAGKRCRFLNGRGHFGRPTGCSRRRVYLSARGAGRWRFARRGHFRRGTYRAFVRAIDAAGNLELRRRRDNALTFRVR